MAVWKKQCSTDSDDFVVIDLPDVGKEPIASSTCNGKDPWHPDILDVSWKELQKAQFEQLFDSEGRLVDEHELRKAVFRGGVEPSIRKEVWRFLFGLFPFHSTQRERQMLFIDYRLRYRTRKEHCQNVIKEAKLNVLSNYCEEDKSSEIDNSLRINYNCTGADNLPGISYDDKQNLNCMKLLAKVEAQRQTFHLEKLITDMRLISKDVPRTDRDHPYFSGESNPHLQMLQNILVTFSAYHPEIGYFQGMNDILSRFLVVLDAEDEAYWCFSKYMESTQKDYSSEGMKRKLELLSNLLEKTAPDLYYYLLTSEIGVSFCHRWLLVGFKREFNYNEGLTLFEILSSHYLEMNSLETQRAKQFGEMNVKKPGHSICLDEPSIDVELTFDLFVCLALLIYNRRHILLCNDSVMLCKLVNSLAKGTQLSEVLNTASRVFFDYCKKSVIESFVIVRQRKKRKTR